MPMFLTSDAVSLHYNDWGHGRPVVLIHGWPMSSASWDYHATRLAESGYRVISYDRRGFGRSDQPWSGYDYDTLSDDLAQLIEHLNLHDVTLVGYSMGSGEVARYLTRHGDRRIAAAVLLAGMTPQLASSPGNPDGMTLAAFDGLMQALRQDRQRFFGDYAQASFSEPGLRDWYLAQTYQSSERAIAACAQAWYATDFRQDLAGIKVPTLILHGARDDSAPAATTGRLAAQMIGHSQYLEYPEAGHYLLIEQKDAVLRDLLAFLAGERSIG